MYQYVGNSILSDIDLSNLPSDFFSSTDWIDLTGAADLTDVFPNVGNLAMSNSRAYGGLIVISDVRGDVESFIASTAVDAAGNVSVQANGNSLGTLGNGDCFGETSYVRGAKRQASICADGPVTILRVSSTLMEQVSSACQLRFNKVFLRSLIQRLQGTT